MSLIKISKEINTYNLFTNQLLDLITIIHIHNNNLLFHYSIFCTHTPIIWLEFRVNVLYYAYIEELVSVSQIFSVPLITIVPSVDFLLYFDFRSKRHIHFV